MQMTKAESLQQWVYRLIALHDQFVKIGGIVQANQTKQLIKKVYHGEFTIAFCGHFSAGKSSLINELVGVPLLPSSPIPTSANLVKVKAGEPYARVYYKHSEPIEYAAPYDYEEVKTFCRDGDAIDMIEISQETDAIPSGIVLMDTPGIDSTDDAHRLATESALHLADVIFYVMDYNHVQAELNFEFTKRLSQYGKTLYLIVNQIDKHRDEELSFSQFARSVDEAFQQWGVTFERIFYTSLKQKEHVYNEFESLKQLLRSLFREKNDRLQQSIHIAVKQIIDDYMQTLTAQQAEEEQNIRQSLSFKNDRELLEKIEEMENMIDHIKKTWSNARQQFEQQLATILDNAYVMPYETREHARAYLEACQPDFKVGFLFTKQKTEEERKRRLRAFYENLHRNIESQLEWHVRDLLKQFYQRYDIHDHELLHRMQQLTIPLSEQWIIERKPNQPLITGDYVLTYTNDIANEMKRLYRDVALQLIDHMIERGKNQQKLNVYERQLNQLTQERSVWEQLEQLARQREHTHQQLQNAIATAKPLSDDVIVPFVHETFTKRIGSQRKENVSYTFEMVTEERFIQTAQLANETVEQMIGKLRTVSEMIAPLEGLKQLAKEMNEKVQQLQQRTFTIALFGAFSAGKSSFANALIGEHVLPVSPHPTTATINKIVPPTDEYPHGTVVVQVKTEQQLLNDLQHSLRFFGVQVHSLQEAIEESEKAIRNHAVDAKERVHWAFLQAVVRGYGQMKKNLGQLLTISFQQFHEYVANETKSCFVEWIELYYDCPLTRENIILVDTPGADSVNARHTGVAFNYIKNADAIFFVTYYNHAFSKADREFLIQLGRVKDTFSLDKMFFIINAADLAHTKEELQAVVRYVNDQLLQFGIRHPRLFSLSSKWALAEKNGDTWKHDVLSNSGMSTFEQAFYPFIHHEIGSLAIASARLQMKQARQRLGEYIAEAKQSDDMKRKKLQILQQEQQQLEQIIEQYEPAHDVHAIEQELDELVYYIQQRIFFRLPDWFKESFNPSVLHDRQANIKRALQLCLDEFLYSIGFDLAQEMRATSLRMESFMNKRYDLHFMALEKQWKQVHDLIVTKVDLPSFPTIEFPLALEQLDRNIFKKALTLYKNAKSFFEKDEKRYMKEELEKQLREPIAAYIDEQKQRLVAHYSTQWTTAMNRLHRHMREQMNEHFKGLVAALTAQAPIDELQHIYDMIGGMDDE
ncbi:dynamin family protein [Anoxybacillus flavithermus]|uniref:GTPase n=1 Tax=Anoxybacillus flavithermus AK1 TaxID=1297581 RepID=M8D6W9_9BACL|nr:dynamin family protein [Anoxybacillus flavithermus]EMT46592.1 GTPase [Anoxybacillus flavithermus AK1]